MTASIHLTGEGGGGGGGGHRPLVPPPLRPPLGSDTHLPCPARESILRARDGDNNPIRYRILLSIMEADF